MRPNLCVCVCVFCIVYVRVCAHVCVFVCVLCKSLEFMLINCRHHCLCSTMNFILLTCAVGSLYIIEYCSAHAPIARIDLLFTLLLAVDLELISLPPQSGCAQCEVGLGRQEVHGQWTLSLSTFVSRSNEACASLRLFLPCLSKHFICDFHPVVDVCQFSQSHPPSSNLQNSLLHSTFSFIK